MTKRTSTSYLCTIDVNSTVDMETLATIRKTISNLNAMRGSNVSKRVVLRGRKPVVKMQVNGGYYKPASKGLVSYDWAGNIVGGIKNASMIDVYVYDRH